MTPEDFAKAIADLQKAGVVPSGRGWKTALSDLLQISRPTIDKFIKSGTMQQQTDYAIAALLADLDPYPQERLGRPSTVVNRKEQS